MQTCPNCGEQNPDRFRLCGICGTKLVAETTAPEVRKTVSIVFCDLKGSTSLGESLDTETLREVLNLYFNEMRAVLERHGGTVEKYIGDAIMAVFGLPTLHEDDALRAVRAAFEMRETLASVNERLHATWGVRLENRTGVNTGEVVAGDVSAGQRLVTGDTVNTAARLEQAAPVLEVLIGDSTYRLVKDAVDVEPVEPLALKGKAERVPAYRVLAVRQVEGIARRLDAPIVGRERELAVLLDALERARGRGRPELVTVLGPAGVGKSRLLRELLARAGEDVTSLRGRCLSYGDGITFWPLAEVVREAAGVDDDDPHDVAVSKLAALTGDAELTERVGAAIGFIDDAFPLQETFSAARRLFERLAATGPLIVLIDDIHWAEGTFLELIRFVVDTAEAPVVLVCSSRKDLLDEHPDWGRDVEHAHAIELQPLTEAESSLVVENLLGTSLDPGIRTRITDAAEGNPLFVEQMLSMLIDDGIVHRDEEGRWVVVSDPGAFTIPPSISALLSARLDRLGATERAVIERGAVMGQVFFRGAIEDLAPEEVRDAVEPSLESLTRKELVNRDDTIHLAGQEAYRFLHILIRDAAYQGLLKRARAELHERFVDWLERAASDRAMEYEEIRGYHLEQAYLILAQLGPLDDHGRQLGDRGSRYLASAGRRAVARGDMPAAGGLLQRAATLVSPESPERPRLNLEAGEAFIETGEFASAETWLTAAIEQAAALGDRGLEATAQLSRLRVRYSTEPEETERMVVAEVDRAIPVLEELEDHAGLARAWRLLTQVNFTTARYGAAEIAARTMIKHAGQAGDPTLEARFLPSLAVCAVYGPMPVPIALERCEELLVKAGHDRRTEAIILCVRSHLLAMQGRFEEAREHYRRSRAMLEELGWRFHAALTSIDSGAVEMLADDPAAAEAELRGDLEVLRSMGERDYLPTIAALLAEAVLEQGRDDEADTLTRESETSAAADDVFSQTLWRSVRAKVLARRGELDEATALATEAVRLIDETDDPDSQGNARMDLAEVVALAGRAEEAQEVVRRAASSFEAKGNVVSAERARERLAALTRVG
ncbi:MAG TPA: adenylate/guanylate cyclase domain-containing protein [Actinomycetota bacterium]